VIRLIRYLQEKPLAIILLCIAIVGLGIFSFIQLRLQMLPAVNIPVISIETNLPGYSASEINTLMTKPLMEKLKQADQLEFIYGQSYPGKSFVNLQFFLNVDGQKAYQQSMRLLRQNIDIFPKMAGLPQTQLLNINQAPVIWLFLSSKTTPIYELSNLYKQQLKVPLLQIPGVQKIKLVGYRKPSVSVKLSPEKLTAYRLVMPLVVQALQNSNVTVPAYYVDNYHKEFLLDQNLHSKNLESLGNTIITMRDGAPIRLKDVATLSYTGKETRDAALYNGKQGVAIGVEAFESSNDNAVIKQVKALLPKLQKAMPAGIKFEEIHDITSMLNQHIHDLEIAFIASIIFAMLIVYVFLYNFRAVWSAVLVLPLSICIVLIVLYMMNESLNVVTLLGLILLIAVVIDDAILVVEGVFSQKEKNPAIGSNAASINAIAYVTPVIITYALCLVVIFASIYFMKGVISDYVSSMSVVMVTGVIASALVSIFVMPVLTARMFRNVRVEHGEDAGHWASRFIDKIRDGYVSSLRWLLCRNWLGVLILAVFILPTPLVAYYTGTGFFPVGEKHESLVMPFQFPQSANLKQINASISNIEKVIQKNPHVKNTLATIGPGIINKGKIVINLKAADWRYSKKVKKDLEKAMQQFPNVRTYIMGKPLMNSIEAPVQFYLLNSNYKALQEDARVLSNRLESVGDFNVEYTQRFTATEYHLDVNDLAAARIGYTPKEVAETVALFGGRIPAGQLASNRFGDYIPIYINPSKNSLINPSDMQKMYLIQKNGQLVRMDTVATLKSEQGYMQFNRFNDKFYTPFHVFTEMPLLQAVTKTTKFAKDLPNHSTIQYLRQPLQLLKALTSISIGLIVSILLIFIIMAVKFNSLWRSLFAIFGEITSLSGAIYGTFLLGYTINLFSMIGALLGLGLVTKNAIILIGLYHKEEGLCELEALVDLCKKRFRPILMTSLAIILAMMPVFFFRVAEARQNISLSIAVIFGMIASTIASFYLIPCLLMIEAKCRNKNKKGDETP